MLADACGGCIRVMGRASGPSTRCPEPPPRCADCVAPPPGAVTLACAASLGDMESPRVTRLDRNDGRARRRIYK